MPIAIAAPAPKTTYQSNLQKIKDETPSRETRIRFKPTVTVRNASNSLTTQPLSDTSPDTQMTADSVPVTGIQSEPDLETISALTPIAVEEQNRAKK